LDVVVAMVRVHAFTRGIGPKLQRGDELRFAVARDFAEREPHRLLDRVIRNARRIDGPERRPRVLILREVENAVAAVAEAGQIEATRVDGMAVPYLVDEFIELAAEPMPQVSRARKLRRKEDEAIPDVRRRACMEWPLPAQRALYRRGRRLVVAVQEAEQGVRARASRRLEKIPRSRAPTDDCRAPGRNAQS
jgi:hypothetical protein